MAAAQPSVWEVARAPARAREYQTLVSVERFMLGHATSWDEMNVHKSTIDYLRGEHYLDPRLELFLGELRLEATGSSDKAVERRLRAVLPERLPPSLVPQAYFELARLAALSGQLDSARDYATRALEGLWEPDVRARAYYLRAKVTHERGQPSRALGDYQRATLLGRSPKVRALAHWGLAVALERSGNLNAALKEVAIAAQIRVRSTAFVAKSVLDLPDVFFFPAFDSYYYKALAALAAAESSDIPEQAAVDCQAAITYLDTYLEAARPAKHRYVPNAVRLKRRCEVRIAETPVEEAGPEPE